MENILTEFRNSIDISKDYTFKELTELLKKAYNKYSKSKNSKKSSDNGENKKTPSAYNIFIKEEIARMKSENKEGIDPKQLLQLAAQKWQEHKNKTQ